MEKDEFTVDSLGHCLVCLAKLDPQWRLDESPPYSISSLQALCHFLNLDLDVTKFFIENRYNRGPLPSNPNNFILKGALCQDCGSIHSEFLKFYQQLVKIELKMVSWLKLLRWKLSEADAKGQAEFYKRRVYFGSQDVEIVEGLRRETLNKCCLKLNSYPPTFNEDNPLWSAQINEDVIVSPNIPDTNTTTPPEVQAQAEKEPSNVSNSNNMDQNVMFKSKCGVCGMGFSNPQSLLGHRLMHFDKSASPTSREKRISVFKRIAILRRPKSSVRFECDRCPKTFRCLRELIQHRDLVHSLIRRFECDICPMKFKLQEHLDRHKRLHSYQPELECQRCSRKFRLRSELLQHRNVDHTKRKVVYKTSSSLIEPVLLKRRIEEITTFYDGS